MSLPFLESISLIVIAMIEVESVDCDLILGKSGTELFKASKQYGEPLFHSPNAILQTCFGFNYTGRYTLPLEDVRLGVLDPYFQLNKSSIKYKFM